MKTTSAKRFCPNDALMISSMLLGAWSYNLANIVKHFKLYVPVVLRLVTDSRVSFHT